MATSSTGLSEPARLTAPSVLASSVLWNLVGQVSPLFIGLALTPFIIGRLGGDRFGVLSLGWTVLTLSLVFNLGLGRTTTKFAADHLVKQDLEPLPALFWTSVLLNVVFGLAGAALLGGGSAWLIELGVLKVPPPIRADAQAMFLIIAFALPFTFVTTTLRGMLEAGQHFRELTSVRVIFTVALFALPAVALLFSSSLQPIAWLLTLSRVLETAACAWLCVRRFPSVRVWRLATTHLRALLVYGGWLTVTNMLLPLIQNMDRFVIGALLSVRAVAYYAVPADLVTRFSTFPAAVTAPLFPAFSALAGQGDHEQIAALYLRTMKYVTLVMAAVVALTLAFASTFLTIWLGAEFADHSTLVMQILVIATLVNAVAFFPYTVLQAVGRPDLTAKCHLLETPLSVPLMWVLTERYGIAGTAVAWAARVAVDAVLLLWLTARMGYLTPHALREVRGGRTVALVLALVVGAVSVNWASTLPARLLLAAIIGTMWIAGVARFAFDDRERDWLRLQLQRVRWAAA